MLFLLKYLLFNSHQLVTNLSTLTNLSTGGFVKFLLKMQRWFHWISKQSIEKLKPFCPVLLFWMTILILGVDFWGVSRHVLFLESRSKLISKIINWRERFSSSQFPQLPWCKWAGEPDILSRAFNIFLRRIKTSPNPESPPECRAHWAFKIFDYDNDGLLSRTDIRWYDNMNGMEISHL